MLFNLKLIQLKNKKMLWRLTGINIILITVLVLLSSMIIYNTACFLVEQMPNVDESKQTTFNESLYTYLLWISPIIIVIGSILHFSIMKKMLKPIKELVASTEVLQHGQYPSPMKITSHDEIGELTQNFNELIDRLKKNEHARNKMITDMAHELRTPLSNINGYLEGLKNEVIEGSPKLYNSLHKESERLIQMINQLYELNEWNYGVKSQSFEKKNVRIDILLSDCMNLFKLEVKKKEILMDIYVDEAILVIDEKGIQQAVMNLIQNAIQYYTGKEKVILRGEELQDDYYISVTGPGEMIPEDQREWLFERFYKVDSSRNRKMGGTGLGLAIVKEIVVGSHKGNIGMDSKGNLHTFWFTIPK